MNPSIPEFGVAVPGCAYELRQGAYALLRDCDDRVAVVMTSVGCFLPGGGQKPGETPEQTVRRETVEECGFEVRVGRLIGVADEFSFSPTEDRYFRKRCAFYEAEGSPSETAVPTEQDHRTDWLPVGDAISRLSHESHRWALRKWIAEQAGCTERRDRPSVSNRTPLARRR